MKLQLSNLVSRALIATAAAAYALAALFGESLAAASLCVSLSVVAATTCAGSRAHLRRPRWLDVGLLAAASATLISLSREVFPLAGAGISLAVAAAGVYLLSKVRDAQPDARFERGLAALQFALAAGGLMPFIDAGPIAALVPPAAALCGALATDRSLAGDGSLFGFAAPAMFSAAACALALAAPAQSPASRTAASVCAALIVAHAAEIELRRAAEASDTSRKLAKLRCLVENIDEAICAADLTGEMTFVNRRFLRMFGLQATFGGRFSDLLDEDDKPAFRRQVRACLESGEPIGDRRYRARRSDGSLVPIECSIALVEVGGIRIGLQATLRDISREQLIEESQRALSQRLEFFLDAMPLGCIVWDVDFRVQEWNPSAERIFGWSQLEVLGRRYDEVLSTHESDSVLESWPSLVQGRQTGRRACRNRSKAGAVIDCEWFHTALLDNQGQVVAVASMVQDVSDRRRLEAQLREAQKLDAVGTLAGGVAHDFNNLLTVIVGNVAMTRMRLGPDHAAVSSLSDAQTAAERAADLVRQLLSFSRTNPAELRPTRIGDSLTETARLFRHGLADDIAFDVEVPDTLPEITADVGQVGQLIMNLLVNAQDAVQPGGKVSLRAATVELGPAECRARAWAGPGRFVVISVSDDGHGMDEQTKSRIFEPFFTTKEVGKGTGLGLAVAYGIVQNHGGGVEVESSPEAGATFRVYLPACRDGCSDGGSQLPASVEGRLLLVERDPRVRLSCSAALRGDGFVVLEASDEIEAIEHARAVGEALDIAVIDMTMPGRSSWIAWVEIRRLLPKLPFVLTGGHDWIAGGLPEQAFLPKPFRPDALRQAIINRLGIRNLSAV